MAKITDLPAIDPAAIDGSETVPAVKDGEMGRATVSELLQPIVDVATTAAEAAHALTNFRDTLAAGVADFAVGEYFSSAETGELRIYKRIADAPFYVDQGDAAAPLTKAKLGADAGFTLIKHRPQEEGTFARTAAQRALAGIADDGATYVNHWIDPDLDPYIALNNGTVDTDLTPAFHAARDTAWGGITRGRTGAVRAPSGFYSVGETVEMGLNGLKFLGGPRTYIKQMAVFEDPLFGVDADVEYPRIVSCDWTHWGGYVRNSVVQNLIVYGNGSNSVAFWDRGVSNSERSRLIARNVGGAVLAAHAGVDSYYIGIQSLIRAEGLSTEAVPDYGVIVGRAQVGDPELVGFSATTQCRFFVRMEEVRLWALLLRYSDTNRFAGMAESLEGGAVLIEAPSLRNVFEQFYCEANAGLDWDIYGNETVVGDQCTSYNGGPTTSIRIRSGAKKTSIRDCGNTLTVIDIDAGAEDTFLQNLVTRQINDSGTRTQRTGFIYQHAVSTSVLHSQTFGNVADSNAKALDWYEEGTFTPTFTGSSGAGTLGAYAIQDAKYQRIGNAVRFRIALRPGTVTAAPSGSLLIGGLPFTAAAGQNQTVVVGDHSTVNLPGTATQLSATVLGGTTTIALRALTDNAASQGIAGSDLVANTTTVFLAGWYDV